MSENKYTPEPWAYGEDNDGWYVEKDGIQIAHGLTEENARRIVACVNACAGIRTEALEYRCHLLKAEDDQIATLSKQRDELLAVLDRLAFAAECRDNTTGDQCRLIEVRAELAAAAANARAVIATATGTNITATIKCAANCGADVPVMAKDEGEDHLCHHCGRDAE